MKKLVISALFVSVFFIGISGLINGVSAKLGSDAKALELVRASRIALGGNQNLAAVRSMSIKASTTHFYEKNGVSDVKQGSLEINFELPGKFSKRVMIGTPGEGGPDAFVEKDIDVIVGDGSMPAKADGKDNIFIIRKGDGKNIEWTSDDGGDVEFTNDDGKQKFRIRKEAAGSGENEWVTDDGQNVRMEKRVGSGPGGAHKGNEMLRMTVGLLMTAPEDGSVTYKYLGEGNVDGFPSNIIGVESNGSTFKLYLDAGSNLPQMISYAGHGPHRVFIKKDNEVVKDDIVGGEGERQMKFADFRSVGSLLLPYRWTESSNGKVTQNIDVTGFELNPADIAERLGNPEGGDGAGRRIVIRKEKN